MPKKYQKKIQEAKEAPKKKKIRLPENLRETDNL